MEKVDYCYLEGDDEVVRTYKAKKSKSETCLIFPGTLKKMNKIFVANKVRKSKNLQILTLP